MILCLLLASFCYALPYGAVAQWDYNESATPFIDNWNGYKIHWITGNYARAGYFPSFNDTGTGGLYGSRTFSASSYGNVNDIFANESLNAPNVSMTWFTWVSQNTSSNGGYFMLDNLAKTALRFDNDKFQAWAYGGAASYYINPVVDDTWYFVGIKCPAASADCFVIWGSEGAGHDLQNGTATKGADNIGNQLYIGGRTANALIGNADRTQIFNISLEWSVIKDYYNKGYTVPAPAGPVYSQEFLAINNTGVNKTTFGEGEDFTVNARFNYANSTNITNANCSFVLENGIIETDAANDNFTLCATCDFSTYTDLLTGLTGIAAAAGEDNIHFHACHNQLAQGAITAGIRCGTTSYYETIPAVNVPLCADGTALIFVQNSSCSLETSVNISVSYTGIANRGKTITGFALDRQYNTLNVDGAYNATTKLYEAPGKYEYYKHGSYDADTYCDIDAVTETLLKTLTIVNIPPQILFNSVFMPGVAVQTLDGSDLQYYAGVWNFSISLLDDDIDTFQINISNASQVLVTFNSTPFNASSDLFRDFGHNPFNIRVWVNDTFGDVANDTIYFNVTDTINPFCTGLGDMQAWTYGDYIFNWSISCADQSFFSFNLSCDSGFSYYKSGLNVQAWNFLNTTTINTTAVCLYEYCDGHTAQEIGLTKLWFVRPDRDKIEFQIGDAIHTLKSLDGGNITYTKLMDRVVFAVALDKISPLGADFQYTTSPNAYYFPSEIFPGWIVDGQSLIWFDMLQEYPGYTVSVIRWNYTTWNINVKPPLFVDNDAPVNLEFRSIGELNCISGTQYLNVTSPPVVIKNSVIRPPPTVALALILIFLYAVWFVLIVLTYALEGPNGHTVQLFNIAQLCVGILLLIYVFKTFNGLLAMVTGLVSVGVFVGKALGDK